MFKKRTDTLEEHIDVIALAKDKAKLEVEKETLGWRPNVLDYILKK